MSSMAIRSLARAFAYAALLLATASYSACPAHQEMLLRYGYAEVRPPARILMPGSLIVLTNREPLEARVICGAEASLGPNVRYMRSTTADASLKKVENKRFDVDASAVHALREHEHFESVHSVTATLHNATILEVSDAEVVRGLTERSYECAEAVRQRIAGGYTVTMVSSALVADMSYQVQWDQKHGHRADMADKAKVLNDLAVVLEGNVTSTASGEIRATGLVWGIRDDEYLSALSAATADSRNFARDTRHIPAGHVAQVKGDGQVAVEAQPMPRITLPPRP